MTRTSRVFIGLGVLLAGALLLSDPNGADRRKLEMRHKWPEYATYFTDDQTRNQCLVDMGAQLRGTRTDYVQMASIACDAARNVHNEQLKR